MILYYNENTKDKKEKSLILKLKNAKTDNEEYVSDNDLKFYLFKMKMEGENL